MKIVLIDDERLAREELRGLLSELPGAEVVGEAVNVADALQVVAEIRPDLIFLDIEMPGSTGFDLLTQLPPPLPRVIFVTAYNAHAVRAFEVNALDYLLKPIVPERLAEAWRRARESASEAGETAAAHATLGEEDQVFLRDEEKCWFVPVRRLRLLEGSGNHTSVHFDHEKPLLYRTLVSMESRLPASLFIRANRSQLINRLFIQKVEPWFSGAVKVTLTDGTEIEFSRRQAQLFRDRMGL